MAKKMLNWQLIKALLSGIAIYLTLGYLLSLIRYLDDNDYRDYIYFAHTFAPLILASTLTAYFAPYWKIQTSTFIAVVAVIKKRIMSMSSTCQMIDPPIIDTFYYDVMTLVIPCLCAAILGYYLSRKRKELSINCSDKQIIMAEKLFNWPLIKALLLGIAVYFALGYLFSLIYYLDYKDYHYYVRYIHFAHVFAPLVLASTITAYFSPYWKIQTGTLIAVVAAIEWRIESMIMLMDGWCQMVDPWAISTFFHFDFMTLVIPCLCAAVFGYYLSRNRKR